MIWGISQEERFLIKTKQNKKVMLDCFKCKNVRIQKGPRVFPACTSFEQKGSLGFSLSCFKFAVSPDYWWQRTTATLLSGPAHIASSRTSVNRAPPSGRSSSWMTFGPRNGCFATSPASRITWVTYAQFFYFSWNGKRMFLFAMSLWSFFMACVVWLRLILRTIRAQKVSKFLGKIMSRW